VRLDHLDSTVTDQRNRRCQSWRGGRDGSGFRDLEQLKIQMFSKAGLQMVAFQTH
jgi:hypothetical protein